jgi:hypothetical protein
VRVGDPLQRSSLPAQPGAVSSFDGWVGDRARDLDDLADEGYREAGTEQIGD